MNGPEGRHHCANMDLARVVGEIQTRGYSNTLKHVTELPSKTVYPNTEPRPHVLDSMQGAAKLHVARVAFQCVVRLNSGRRVVTDGIAEGGVSFMQNHEPTAT